MPELVFLILRIALVAILYAFLLWSVLTLWRDLRQQGDHIVARQVPIIHVMLDGELAGTVYHFNRPQLTLGRSPTCDCVLEDGTVSSQHARLIYRQNQWWIDDLNSTNGTFLNGQRVTTLTVITTGDQLRLGQVSVSIAIGENPTRPV